MAYKHLNAGSRVLRELACHVLSATVLLVMVAAFLIVKISKRTTEGIWQAIRC